MSQNQLFQTRILILTSLSKSGLNFPDRRDAEAPLDWPTRVRQAFRLPLDGTEWTDQRAADVLADARRNYWEQREVQRETELHANSWDIANFLGIAAVWKGVLQASVATQNEIRQAFAELDIDVEQDVPRWFADNETARHTLARCSVDAPRIQSL